MLIRIWIERNQALVGTAATDEAEPLHFDGWPELLRVISELVEAPSDGEDVDAARESMQGTSRG